MSHSKTITLVGNPNVGKSSLFNALTGLRQHTGNWHGKTVDSAAGDYTYKDCLFTLVDIPGTYSLNPYSADEKVASDFILSGKSDMTLIVIDGTCLERGLHFALEVMSMISPVALCINLLDEAYRKGITIDFDILAKDLNIPVIGTAASNGTGLHELRDVIYTTSHVPSMSAPLIIPASSRWQMAEVLAKKVIVKAKSKTAIRDVSIDKLITSRKFAIPSMLILLSFIFWFTIQGANVPSELLSNLLLGQQDTLLALCTMLHLPDPISSFLVYGIYRTAAWVVSVMLPPMAIFFPLFTLLEDLGYLPRIAFNMDHFFQKSCACGKQALTMCLVVFMLLMAEMENVF